MPEVSLSDVFLQPQKGAQKGVQERGCRPQHTPAVNPSTRLMWRVCSHRTTISSSQRVEARFESFDRFIFHDFSPMPSEAEKTLPLP